MFFEKAAAGCQSRIISGQAGEMHPVAHPLTYIIGVKAPICLTRIDI